MAQALVRNSHDVTVVCRRRSTSVHGRYLSARATAAASPGSRDWHAWFCASRGGRGADVVLAMASRGRTRGGDVARATGPQGRRRLGVGTGDQCGATSCGFESAPRPPWSQETGRELRSLMVRRGRAIIVERIPGAGLLAGRSRPAPIHVVYNAYLLRLPPRLPYALWRRRDSS